MTTTTALFTKVQEVANDLGGVASLIQDIYYFGALIKMKNYNYLFTEQKGRFEITVQFTLKDPKGNAVYWSHCIPYNKRQDFQNLTITVTPNKTSQKIANDILRRLAPLADEVYTYVKEYVDNEFGYVQRKKDAATKFIELCTENGLQTRQRDDEIFINTVFGEFTAADGKISVSLRRVELKPEIAIQLAMLLKINKD